MYTPRTVLGSLSRIVNMRVLGWAFQGPINILKLHTKLCFFDAHICCGGGGLFVFSKKRGEGST